MTESKTLYARLGGYDAIAAVADDLVARLRTDPQLGRFWAHRVVGTFSTASLDPRTFSQCCPLTPYGSAV